MALRELQIAPEIVSVAFTLTLGAIALAAALAFGLGDGTFKNQELDIVEYREEPVIAMEVRVVEGIRFKRGIDELR